MVMGNALLKVKNVNEGEGLKLWRLLAQEYEPKQYKTRRMVQCQAVLGYAAEDTDVWVVLDKFENLVNEYQNGSGKTVDDETKAGVILRALANGDADQRDLSKHLVLNCHRIETYEQIKQELREIVGTNRFLGRSAGGVHAIAKGSPKGGGRGQAGGRGGDGKLQLTIKFQGDCWAYARPQGHRVPGQPGS